MQPRGSLLVRLCSLVAVLIEYDKKGKSTAYSSQTVFHNVCSEHAVLFLYLCYLVSKGAPKAATPNCIPQDFIMCEHDIFRPELIQWLGLFDHFSFGITNSFY